MSKLTFIDVFSGAGGFSLGLQQGGLQGIFAVERDPMAFNTFFHNFLVKRNAFDWPDWLPKTPMDVVTLIGRYTEHLARTRGKIDVVVGGPPCQGFSTAGRRIEHDERNMLFKQYLKLVNLVKPRVLVFENVPGFAIPFKVDGIEKSYSELLSSKLKDAGYGLPASRLVDFSELGVPQSRKRLLIVAGEGPLDPESMLDRIDKCKVKQSVTVKSAISDLLMKNGVIPSPDSPGFSAGVYGTVESRYQERMREGIVGRIPDSHRFAKHHKGTVRRLKRILESAPQGRRAIERLLARMQLKKRLIMPLTPCLPAPTLTTLPDDYVHYAEPRILTVREYARLQSFPDWFEFKGKYTTGGILRRYEVPRYSQVANAVPPLVSRKIAQALCAVLC